MTGELNPGTVTATPDPATAARPGSGTRPRRLPAYARLAKLGMVDYYLSLIVVWSLLPAAGVGIDGSSWATLIAFLLGAVGLVAAAVAFDDVAGYRDGSDAANYGADAPVRRCADSPASLCWPAP
jgi:1,4-dihydroxy-2-naphthoate octaprenyltransferase